MSDGIVEFIVAQLDIDEQIARNAPGGCWEPQAEAWPESPEARVWTESATGREVQVAEANGVLAAAHIARHDPERVLADVEAKRRVLERHCVTRAKRDYPDLNACEGCGSAGYGYGYRTPDINQCPELRTLAAPYAGQRGFKPQWSLP